MLISFNSLIYFYQFSSVQFTCSVMSNSATPWTAAHQASLSITNSRSLLKLMFIDSVMPSNPLILCQPLLLLPSVFPSIRVFSNESVLLIRWPKFWSFSFSISPPNEHPGLISFRMDWLDLLAVQGTLKSFLQHHSSKVSILQHSAFFIVQQSHPYMNNFWLSCYKVLEEYENNWGIPFALREVKSHETQICKNNRTCIFNGEEKGQEEKSHRPLFLPGNNWESREVQSWFW